MGARIVVLISGSGSNLQALIDAKARGALSGDIVRVISSSKKAYGLERSSKHGIPTRVHSLYPYTKGIAKEDKSGRADARKNFEIDLASVVLEDKPDLIVCAGWLLILGSEFLKRVNGVPIINLHPALPGAFDGTTHAIEMAWKKCQDEGAPLIAGCMVHFVIEEVDRGEPVVIKELQLMPGEESLEKYEERVHAAEHVAIVEAVQKVLKANGESAGTEKQH
ncbi:phosphoribosylglycinamide formyltransferase [Lachancea thermotolerans CBS 6340]|uniref:Phosphoribosylglycinamide formyltransferase n=1 Tax=Lachancea thermotolerans (strain ATCC 56472 / CBS 6340 / NRRL Y-8284) TaxID=559295 RepID=C5DLT0_LACTC|nr:KLTH0G03190p [Lachancea thermotolerans CBS 6340]CAR24741.1 KLTH0G03190p [Lachancea thermotolerans CBS 6340]